MHSNTSSISSIGAGLVREARSRPEDALPLSTQIFPYALIASRKMSLREISAWLEENHGITISAMAISRALRAPDMHLSRLADYISSLGNYVALATKSDLKNLLYEDGFDNLPNELERLAREYRVDGLSPKEIEIAASVEELNTLWNCLPFEVQLLLQKYFEEEDLEPERPDNTEDLP